MQALAPASPFDSIVYKTIVDELASVSQFCRTGNIFSNVSFCFQEPKYVSATRQKHSVFSRGIEPCFLMFPSFSTIGNICSLATIARMFLGFPTREKVNMADSRENSSETSASSKKNKGNER